jgi:hypothetical protein
MKNIQWILILSCLLLNTTLVQAKTIVSHSKQERVAIIDGIPDTDILYDRGVSLCKPYERVIIRYPNDFNKHGTNIALTVMKDVSYDDACLLLYNLNDGISKSIRQAVADGATIINLSVGGPSANKEDAERLAILYALVRGVKVVISAGNEDIILNKDICKTLNLIGCYALIPSWNKYLNKNLFYVGHWHKIGTELVSKGSNKFTGMQFVPVSCSKEGFYLCGTSQSAAYFTNTLLNKKERKR